MVLNSHVSNTSFSSPVNFPRAWQSQHHHAQRTTSQPCLPPHRAYLNCPKTRTLGARECHRLLTIVAANIVANMIQSASPITHQRSEVFVDDCSSRSKRRSAELLQGDFHSWPQPVLFERLCSFFPVWHVESALIVPMDGKSR
jgi:hypothetical protein